MNSSQSLFFIFCGILIALGLIIFLLVLRKKNHRPLIFSDSVDNSIEKSVHFQGFASPQKVSESITPVDEELEQLIEIENSLLAVKELYLKRLISAQKYVDETRLIAQQKKKY